MTRLELSLWAAVMLLMIVATTTAKADHFRPGPPVERAYALSIELSRQAAALSYDAERLLCGTNDLDDVLEELCDVADELDDLNDTLRAATFRPRKFSKLCKRAEDVLEEVCELDEEIHEAVDDLNRHRPRQTAYVPRGPSHYRSLYRTAPDVAISFRIGSGSPRLVAHTRTFSSRGLPRSVPYRGAAEGYVRPRVGCELEQRVRTMRAIAEELHRLAHAG